MTKHRDLTLFLLVASFALHTPLLAQEDAWQRSLEQGKTALDDYEYETAENHLLAALETASELSDPDLKIAATLDELGRLYSARGGKYGQAEPSFRRALEIRKAAYGPNHLEVADSHARLAEMLFKGDKDAEAEQHFRRALEIRQDLLGETHPDVARSWTRIGLAQWYQGKFDEAEASCQRALELQEQSLGPNDLGLVEYVETLGDFYLLNRKEQEALAQFRRGVEIREQVWGPDDPRFVAALRERGGYYSDSDLDDEAIRVLERALSIQEKLHGSDSNEVAQVLGELATACRWSEQADRTENLYLRAIRIRERFDPPTLDLAAHLVSLAELYRAEERYAEAAKLCERGLSIRSAHLQPNDRRVTALLKELGELHSFTENWPQAESYYQRLLAIQQKDDPNSYGAGMTLVALGDAYLAQQKNAEAAEALTVALASIEEEWGKDSQQVLEVHLKLADAYTQLGQPADAQRHQQRAGEIQMTLLWTELSAGLKESWGQVTGDVPSWVIGAVALIVLLMLAFVATVGYLAARLTRHLLQQHEPPPGAPVPPPDSSLDPTPSAVTEPEPPAEARVVAPLPAVLESGPVSYPAEASPPLPALGSDLSATPSTPLPAPLETRRFAFHGEGGSLFGIHIVNVLLTLLTLGIYYFWGKVKVRRYLYSQAEFDGDRFAFHGTGKELFFGWLKIVPALAFLIWFPIILMMVWDSPLAASVGQFTVVGTIFLLLPVAQIGAFRYRASRSSWRGIRFSFRGKTLTYWGKYLRGLLLTMFTFGIYSPFWDVKLHGYRFDHTYFGNTRFRFSGRGIHILPAYLISWIPTLMTFGVYGFWYRAELARYYWAQTTFAGGRVRCTITGGKLFWLTFTNLLLTLFTLGLAFPWVAVRTSRLWLDHLYLEGAIDMHAVEQHAQAGGASAEGFADFLGLEFGF